ncbi:hypothetical protein M569_06782, partial [Genlisea aurea]
MASFRDWVFSQVISNSIGSIRHLSDSGSFLSQETRDEELDSQGNLFFLEFSGLARSNDISQQVVSGLNFNHEKGLSPIDKVEALKIKFFRLLKRLNLSQSNLTVAKTLYRIHLATLIKSQKSDIERANSGPGISAQAIASKQEEVGFPEFDFSIKILVKTNAFRPATDQVHEIVGVINGIKLSFIDTPGLLPASSDSDFKNRKILLSIKRFIRKSPPDVVLYFERLDLISIGGCDFRLPRLITEILGPPIWFSTSIVMTHSCAALPEDGAGYPVSYDPFVGYCTELVRRRIHEAIFDSKLENPVILVENHPYCKVDVSGRKILPNGQRWISQFMLLCLCTKILGDVNRLFDFVDTIQLGPVRRTRLPSMPHLLSNFLKHRVKLSFDGGDSEMEDFFSSSGVEEDDDDEEYDELPPISILTRAQFQKLSPSQRREYLDELDHREMLFMKKHMKQEYLRRKNDGEGHAENGPDEEAEAFVLPDLALPSSFDPHSPVHRYRCLVRGDRWLARPVLDPDGWDHDVGFDGINVESAAVLGKHFASCVAGQLSKDKRGFDVQCESTVAAAFSDARGPPAYSLGLDLQSADRGSSFCGTLRGNAKAGIFKSNVAECGFSVTSFGDRNSYYGVKVEDSILVAKRLRLRMNLGRISAGGHRPAHGGNFEAVLNGKDYPARREKSAISMSVLCHGDETVLGGDVQADFRLSRGTNVAVGAHTNSRKMGQVRLKVSSSDHVNFAAVAVIAFLFRRLLLRKNND